MQFKFYPTLSLDELNKQGKPSAFKKSMASLGNSLGSSIMNAADNLTGGIVSSIMQGDDEESILKMREKFKDAHKHTFMEYLAKANLL